MTASIEKSFQQFLTSKQPPEGFSEKSFQKISTACQIANKWLQGPRNGIPKLIMQTAKTEEIPEDWKVSIPSYRKHFPDWTHILLTDEDNDNFVRWFFPDFLKVFRGFSKGIMRADAVRYMWFYMVGGIYSDLDYECLRNFEHIFEETNTYVYLIQSGNVHVSTNSFMASKPRAEMWLDLIRLMAFRARNKPWWCLNSHFTIMGTTGPLALQHTLDHLTTDQTYAFLPSRLFHPFSTKELLKVAPEEQVEFVDQENGQKKIVQPYLRQLKGESWHQGDSVLLNKFFCRPKEMMIVVLLILFLAFAFIMMVKRTRGKSGAILATIVILIFLIFLIAPLFTE